MKIQVVNKAGQPLPEYQTEHAAAVDVHAYLPDGPRTLQPLERAAVGTGLYLAIPAGYELQIRSRSGLSFNHGIICINSPGTIDPDYRGELKILLANLSNEPYEIQHGDRIAQLLVAKTERIEWESVTELDKTAGGDKGLGGTGR